jgi:hypothetical protein
MRNLLLAGIALIGLSGAAQARPAHCFIEVDGHVYLNGTCNFEFLDKKGSFTIGVADGASRASKYFAYVWKDDDGVVTATWNGTDASSHAQDDLGPGFVRQRECWVNDHAKICAL